MLARAHFEQGVTRYHLQREHFRGVKRGEDPGVACLAFLVSTLGFLGYPDQAWQCAEQARQLAQELAHPYSLAFARYRAALYALFYRQAPTAQALAEEVLDVAMPHGFPFYAALGTAVRGGALVLQGQGDEGLVLLRQGWEASTPPGPSRRPTGWSGRLDSLATRVRSRKGCASWTRLGYGRTRPAMPTRWRNGIVSKASSCSP